jgi:hypothetical protein
MLCEEGEKTDDLKKNFLGKGIQNGFCPLDLEYGKPFPPVS